MATTKTFNIRISNRYDSLEQWQANNPLLLAGEIALVKIGSTQTDANGNIINVPCIMAKIGNNTDRFNNLPWLSGLSANSPSWSLADTKPDYEASEIINLAEFINEHAPTENTKYQIVADATDPAKMYLQSTDDADADPVVWTTVSTFYSTTVEAGTTPGTIKVNGTEMAITGYSDLSDKVDTIEATADANKTAIDTLNGSVTTEGSVAKSIKDANDALKSDMQDEINAKIASTYRPAGSTTPVDGTGNDEGKKILDTALLTKANVGNVYNVSEEFSGANVLDNDNTQYYPAGTNVVVINAGTETAPDYKFDVLTGFIDTSSFATKTFVGDNIDYALANLTADDIPDLTSDKITNFDSAAVEAVNDAIDTAGSTINATVSAVAKTEAENIVNALDVADAEVASEFITSVSQNDGVVSVTRKAVDIADLVQNTADVIIINAGGAAE